METDFLKCVGTLQ